MVELRGRASGLVVNTSRVELEGLVGSIDGYGDGGLVDGGLESRLVTRRDILVRGKGSTNVGRGEAAVVGSSGGVRVRSLSVNSTVGDDVSEGLVHETTVATLVTLGGRAVDEVLLRKADEFASLQEVGTFGGTGGGERPARSALALVLNGGDGSLGSPVPGGGERNVGLGVGVKRCLGHVHSVGPASELFESQVSELVKSDGESWQLISRHTENCVHTGGLSVMRVNEVQVVAEDREAVLVLRKGGIDLAVGLLPLKEGLVVIALGEGESAREECDKKDCDLHISKRHRKKFRLQLLKKVLQRKFSSETTE